MMACQIVNRPASSTSPPADRIGGRGAHNRALALLELHDVGHDHRPRPVRAPEEAAHGQPHLLAQLCRCRGSRPSASRRSRCDGPGAAAPVGLGLVAGDHGRASGTRGRQESRRSAGRRPARQHHAVAARCCGGRACTPVRRPRRWTPPSISTRPAVTVPAPLAMLLRSRARRPSGHAGCTSARRRPVSTARRRAWCTRLRYSPLHRHEYSGARAPASCAAPPARVAGGVGPAYSVVDLAAHP